MGKENVFRTFRESHLSPKKSAALGIAFLTASLASGGQRVAAEKHTEIPYQFHTTLTRMRNANDPQERRKNGLLPLPPYYEPIGTPQENLTTNYGEYVQISCSAQRMEDTSGQEKNIKIREIDIEADSAVVTRTPQNPESTEQSTSVVANDFWPGYHTEYCLYRDENGDTYVSWARLLTLDPTVY